MKENRTEEIEIGRMVAFLAALTVFEEYEQTKTDLTFKEWLQKETNKNI
jgi:hypothetical protein